MKYSWGSTEGWNRRGGEMRALALVALVGPALLGCEAHRMTRPNAVVPSEAKPVAEVVEYKPTCFANSRACGGVFPVIGAYVGAYHFQNSSRIGGEIKTWIPSGASAYVNATGKFQVRRGSGLFPSKEFSPSLACSNFAASCGDGWSTTQSCDVERNVVVGWSTHSASGGAVGIQWAGFFDDNRVCEGPPDQEEQACNEEGEPVEDGGDPANCEESSGGGGGEASGIQYEPGEYTDGETVDWETGIGNGGTSACGDSAQVAEVCIDQWNEDTQSWEEWSCGYATTC